VYFALFFLGEYNNILLGSAVQVILFLGGFSIPYPLNTIVTNFFLLSIMETFFFSLKIVFLCFLFILIRALLPRYRYDHLMQVG
jgi:NADH-quinone oxidoreductase subunit H